MKEKPLLERPGNSLLRIGMLIMCTGIFISALFFWALEKNTSDFGSIGSGLGIIYGGLPIILLGLILSLISLLITRRRKKQERY